MPVTEILYEVIRIHYEGESYELTYPFRIQEKKPKYENAQPAKPAQAASNFMTNSLCYNYLSKIYYNTLAGTTLSK